MQCKCLGVYVLLLMSTLLWAVAQAVAPQATPQRKTKNKFCVANVQQPKVTQLRRPRASVSRAVVSASLQAVFKFTNQLLTYFKQCTHTRLYYMLAG